MERLEKAKIVSVETGETFTVQFNPEELSLSKMIDWNHIPISGKETGHNEFSGGQPGQFTLSLLFDTTDTGLDVRAQYALLVNLAQPKSLLPFVTRGQPPRCIFIWGDIISFEAVISNLTQRFIMFLGSGVPVRAKVEVTFKEAKDPEAQPAQNPTSHSEPRRTRRVQLGDRLDLIAYQEYGDANRWLDIAQANDLEDPLGLLPGQILQIPMV